MSETALVFGYFRLFPAQRRLEKDGESVRLGGRALDILIALAERAGETVSSRALLKSVWPEVKVEDGSLRFHIKNLRRALGEGVDGARYIENVAGQGYCFVAPVARLDGTSIRASSSSVPPRAGARLPKQRGSILGRADSISCVARDLIEGQLVTIAGPAGIGKTTLAVAIVDLLGPHFETPTYFVDLAPIEDGTLVAPTVACALGLVPQARDPLPTIVNFLRDKPVLIVIDNCEQVIAAVAELALHVVQGAPDAHALVTSREPLRIDGERVYRLMPLECPPPGKGHITARDAMTYPAVELFVDRTAANVSGFILDDQLAPLVADICRRLDGIPLAIELAAARVEFLGVGGLARGLDDMFDLLTQGRRFALPRHQTLRATLDWGYNLLSRDEQSVFRDISVFRSAFSLDSALAVAEDSGVSRKSALDAMASLVGKSLLNATESGGAMLYRLLETTRHYASMKLAESGELPEAARRHAEHHLELIESAYRKWKFDFREEWIRLHADRIDDIRAALDWSFEATGDLRLGIELTALSAPLWFALSRIYEYRDRAEYAHARLASAGFSGSEIERALNLSLGTALFYTRGPDSAEKAAAPPSGSPLRAIWQLAGVKLVHGDYRGAVVLSDEFDRICAGTGDEAAAAAGDRLRAFALHLSGRHMEAEVRARRALGRESSLRRAGRRFNESEIDNEVSSLNHLTRILWIRGFAEQAMSAAEEGVSRALSSNDAAAACFILAYGACPVAFWTGNRTVLSRYLALFDQQLANCPWRFWVGWRDAYQFMAGKMAHGLNAIAAHSSLSIAAQPPNDMILVDVLATLSDDLVGPDVIGRAERGECGWCLPEILRARGAILLRNDAGQRAAAEALFCRAIEVAREQGALAWELRAATSLAKLRQAEGDDGGAYSVLSPVCGRFTEGFATADFAEAAETLNALGAVQIPARWRRR